MSKRITTPPVASERFIQTLKHSAKGLFDFISERWRYLTPNYHVYVFYLYFSVKYVSYLFFPILKRLSV